MPDRDFALRRAGVLRARRRQVRSVRGVRAGGRKARGAPRGIPAPRGGRNAGAPGAPRLSVRHGSLVRADEVHPLHRGRLQRRRRGQVRLDRLVERRRVVAVRADGLSSRRHGADGRVDGRAGDRRRIQKVLRCRGRAPAGGRESLQVPLEQRFRMALRRVLPQRLVLGGAEGRRRLLGSGPPPLRLQEGPQAPLAGPRRAQHRGDAATPRRDRRQDAHRRCRRMLGAELPPSLLRRGYARPRPRGELRRGAQDSGGALHLHGRRKVSRGGEADVPQRRRTQRAGVGTDIVQRVSVGKGSAAGIRELRVRGHDVVARMVPQGGRRRRCRGPDGDARLQRAPRRNHQGLPPSPVSLVREPGRVHSLFAVLAFQLRRVDVAPVPSGALPAVLHREHPQGPARLSPAHVDEGREGRTPRRDAARSGIDEGRVEGRRIRNTGRDGISVRGGGPLRR